VLIGADKLEPAAAECELADLMGVGRTPGLAHVENAPVFAIALRELGDDPRVYERGDRVLGPAASLRVLRLVNKAVTPRLLR
jgi:hypothetical protein